VDGETSAALWGFERGYCMMIGGDSKWLKALILFLRRSHRASATSRARRDVKNSAALRNKVICIAARMCGHFVKMVHNGIEYGMMPHMPKAWAFCAAQHRQTARRNKCGDHAVARA